MATNDLLVGYTRRFSGPVDATATFSTLSALQTYASSDATAYAGQICVVTGTNTVYVINTDKTVSAVGAGSGVSSFNTRTGAVSLTSGDVTTALGYTPAQSAGTLTGAAVAPSTLTPQAIGSINQTGTSAYAAHADHIHAAPPASLISGLGSLATLSAVPSSLVSGLATVATSGSYTDLSNKPTIPTSTSQLTNNSGFLTSAPVTSVAGKTGAVSLTASDISGFGGLATLNDAPNDGNQYARQGGAWATISVNSGSSVSFPLESYLVTCDAVGGGSVIVTYYGHGSGSVVSYVGTDTSGTHWLLFADGTGIWYLTNVPAGATVQQSNPSNLSNWPNGVVAVSSNRTNTLLSASWNRVSYNSTSGFVTVSGTILVSSYHYTTALGTTASDGTSTLSARADHVHAAPAVLCPFNAQSSLTFSYDGSGNITTLTYTYGGMTQGYADFAYSGGNLSTITYKGSDHSTVLRTITFSYSGSNISGYSIS